MALRTIEVTPQDQHAVQRALLPALVRMRRSGALVAVCLVLMTVCSLGGLALVLVGTSPRSSLGSYVTMLFSVLVAATTIWWGMRRSVRMALPVGATYRLEVMDATLNLAGPNGISMWRWDQIRRVTELGDAVFLTVATASGVVALPRRLMTDEDLRIVSERIAQSERPRRKAHS